MNCSIYHRLRHLERQRPGPLIGLFTLDGQTEPVEMLVKDAAQLFPGVELVKITSGNDLTALDVFFAAFKDAVRGEDSVDTEDFQKRVLCCVRHGCCSAPAGRPSNNSASRATGL